MITVKNIFLATVLITGSLALEKGIRAEDNDLILNNGDKITISQEMIVGSYGEHFFLRVRQALNDTTVEFSFKGDVASTLFTIKDKGLLALGKNAIESKCFKLESPRGRELKIISVDDRTYQLVESSEKNKEKEHEAWFALPKSNSTNFYGKEQKKLHCFPDGKIGAIPIFYGLSMDQQVNENNGSCKAFLDYKGAHYFDIKKVSSQPSIVAQKEIKAKEKSLEKKQVVSENIKEKVITQEDTITPKAKEDGNQIEELTRKLEEQLEINRKLQEELNNLKASRVSAPRQGARGRGQAQRK